MAVHYCGGKAVETKFALGHPDLHCGMPQMTSHCESKPSEETPTHQKPCCENEYQSLDQDDQYAPQTIQESLNPEFVVTYVVALCSIFYSPENDQANELHYTPPLIARDVPVFVQSFLI